MHVLFLCGDATLAAAPKGAFEKTIRLPIRGRHPALRLEQLDPKLLEALRAPEKDLLEVAAFVYGADRLVSRASREETAEGWVRELTLVVPVRNVRSWNAVRTALEEALNFLTGDHWRFRFVRARTPGLQPTALFDDSDLRGRTCVALFSGGLDSLSGAVWDRAVNQHRPLLVSHRSHAKVSARQNELAARLRDWNPDFRHIQAWVQLILKQREASQRSRSFLFLALAGALANRFDIPVIHVFENGVLSVNLPISPQVVGTAASRTTHPRFLNEMQQILRTLLSSSVVIDLPFLLKTKTEVVRLLADNGADHLISLSSSCGRPMWQSKPHPHCGACSQCIDRRFAVEACNLLDKDTTYEHDLFTTAADDFPDEAEARSIMEGYVRTYDELSTLPSSAVFEHYPEIYDVLPHVPDIDAVVEMYSRQGQVVADVLDHEINRYASQLRKGELPPTCLLQMVAAGELRRDPVRRYAGAVADVARRAIPTAFASRAARDEQDVQTALQTALTGNKERLDREYPTFAYVHGVGTKPDFSGRRSNVFLEVKFIRGESRNKRKITEELMADVTAYGHRASGILFIVFDPERQIDDDEAYRADIERHTGVFCQIVR